MILFYLPTTGIKFRDINTMEIENTKILEVKILHLDVFEDSRGYFYESFNNNKFLDLDLNVNFVQDNISKSKKGTIRGLHYQVGNFAQGKLCHVILGSVMDIAVDIRFNSPTFGQYVSVELSDKNHDSLWIPTGFAHGFEVLSDEAIFSYKCTNVYNKDSERALIFNDKTINIQWSTKNPIVSAKDLLAKSFMDIEKDFIY